MRCCSIFLNWSIASKSIFVICKGSGTQRSLGRMADAAAEANRTLYHHVPSTQGSALFRGTRFHVREESASVQVGATGVWELWLNKFSRANKSEDAATKISQGRSDTSTRLRDRSTYTAQTTASVYLLAKRIAWWWRIEMRERQWIWTIYISCSTIGYFWRL